MFCKEDVMSGEPNMNPYEYHYSLIEPHRKFKPKIKYRHISQFSVYNVMDLLDNAGSIKTLKNSIDSFVDRAHHFTSFSREVTKGKTGTPAFTEKLLKNKREKNMQEKSLLYQYLIQKPSSTNEKNIANEMTSLFDRKISIKEEIEIDNDSSIDWAEISLKNTTSSFSQQIFNNFGSDFFGKENNNSLMTLSLTDSSGRRQVSFSFDSKLPDKINKLKQTETEPRHLVNRLMESYQKEKCREDSLKEGDKNKISTGVQSSSALSQDSLRDCTDEQLTPVSVTHSVNVENTNSMFISEDYTSADCSSEHLDIDVELEEDSVDHISSVKKILSSGSFNFEEQRKI